MDIYDIYIGMVYHIDLTNPDFAYMFGFIQTDGHLSKNSRNRGCMQIELQVADGP